MLPAILKYELAGSALITAYSVALSRALKQTTLNFTMYSCRMQETVWKKHLPLSVPQEKEFNGVITCANKYQRLHARDVQ